MAKHGEGLGYEIVKGVLAGEIIEPITYEKVKAFSNSYDWAFSDLKVGRTQEYSSLNPNGNKRKNELHEEHFKVIREMLISLNDAQSVEGALYQEVEESKQDSHMTRRRRLRNRLEVIPESFVVMTRAVKRNPDVIAEVLIRVDGACERCEQQAPFKRAI